MSDLDKNIYRKNEPPPYEKIIINPIEKERREKERRNTALADSSRPQIFATLVSYLKKILSSLGPKNKYLTPHGNIDTLLAHAQTFKQLLLALSQEDLSHNPSFTEQLAELWHTLIDDCNSLSHNQIISSQDLQGIKFLIYQIQNFPSDVDHSLGYYFTEYAGKAWIPFPFMKLLRELHEEFQQTPSTSTLQTWISLLPPLRK